MNNGIGKVIIFAIGAGIGSIVTWKVVETKYKKIAEEEIESVREVYASRLARDTIHEDEPQEKEHNLFTIKDEKPDIKEYAKKLKDYSAAFNDEKNEEEKEMAIGPYIIKPEEFGECFGYDTSSITYYADDVYEDEYGEVIDDGDIDETIGSDAVSHFGEYEPDAVFIRNDDLKTDYEILRDTKTYAEVNGASD